MAQEDRNGATTTPPSPPPQLQEAVDAALAAQAAAEAAALAAANTPVAAPTNAAASKATPVDADLIPLVDSAASFILKKLTWANLKATLANTLTLLDTTPVVKGSSDATKQLRFEVDGFTAGATRVLTPPNRDLNIGLLSHGQCRLAKSGANLVLSPFNGNKIIINSQLEDVPDAGVSLAPPATTLILYYIYAYMSAGVLTLEASTTAYAVQAGTGVYIKSADATRTLVGMARTVGNAWVDAAAQRFVRTWFNDPGVEVTAAFTANRNTGSVTYVELNTEIRNEFLIWANELATMVANGSAFSGAAGNVATTLAIDGTTPEDVTCQMSNYTSNAYASIGMTLFKTGLTEGYHYVTLLARVTTSSANWVGSASAPDRCTVKTRLRR